MPSATNSLFLPLEQQYPSKVTIYRLSLFNPTQQKLTNLVNALCAGERESFVRCLDSLSSTGRVENKPGSLDPEGLVCLPANSYWKAWSLGTRLAAEPYEISKSAKKETGEQEKAQPRQEDTRIGHCWELMGRWLGEEDSRARPGGIPRVQGLDGLRQLVLPAPRRRRGNASSGGERGLARVHNAFSKQGPDLSMQSSRDAFKRTNSLDPSHWATELTRKPEQTPGS
ncbi:hypothetical protein CB1_000881002 [Camelus ferus]|nr:hypothetical protein CB1_000881002 [Camelus ferus]